MNEAGPIEQLTIDDVTFQVADLSEEIQKLVAKYEDWRDRLVVAQDEALLVASALRDLGANIVGAIKQQEAEADAAAQAAAQAAAEEAEAPAEEAPAEEAPAVVELEVPVAVVASEDTLVVEDDASA